MNITDMIMEWRKGCSCCDNKPIDCNECTLALIKAVDEKAFIDEYEKNYNGFIGGYGISGIAMAAADFAALVNYRQITIRAINEQANKKD